MQTTTTTLATIANSLNSTNHRRQPVIEKSFEVLEQCIFVLLNEARNFVRHLAGVVKDTKVAAELERFV